MRCPSCSHAGYSVGHAHGSEVYSCPNCDLWFVPPSAHAQSEIYEDWYNETSHDIERYLNDMAGAYLRQSAHLKQLTNGRTLLDVGCGIGIFLKFARDDGWEVHGTDFSSGARRIARDQFGLELQHDLSGFPDQSFDVVRISHVLEHVTAPIPFLKELQRVLKPEGILAVATPNREPLSFAVMNRLRRFLKQDRRLTSHVCPPSHVLGLNQKSLTALAERSGLRSLETFTVSMGSPTYFPMFFDGLLFRFRVNDIPVKTLIRYWLPQFTDNIGNVFGRGQWLIGYFTKYPAQQTADRTL